MPFFVIPRLARDLRVLALTSTALLVANQLPSQQVPTGRIEGRVVDADYKFAGFANDV